MLAPCAVISQQMFDLLCDTPQKAHLLNPRTDGPGGGFTVIYGPDGRALCEPLAEDQEGILYANLDPDLITLAKAVADPPVTMRAPMPCDSSSTAASDK